MAATGTAVKGAATKGTEVSAFGRVYEHLGVAITSGTLEAGTVTTVEELEGLTGASRSIVREAVRVLASLGLVRARRRVGVRVLPESEWNLLDTQVIRWRLDSPSRAQQLLSLRELRLAIEPEAARLAARNASNDLAGRIMSAAGLLLSSAGQPEALLEHDATFHSLVLEASGNLMFARLSAVVQEAVRDQTLRQLPPTGPNTFDLQLHVDLAGHIQRHDSDAAWLASREIIQRAMPQEHR